MRILSAGLAALIAAAALAADAPQRIVTVGGAITEIAFALNRGDRVVAADSTSIWPRAAAELPRVGYIRQLSAEGVLALRPDLVLASAEAGPPATLAQLRGAGVRVVALAEAHSFDGLLLKVRTLGEALDARVDAAALERDLVREWQRTGDEVKRLTVRPRVLFLLAHSGNNLLVAGRETAADAMIRLAGGVNAVNGYAGYKPLTAEAAVAAAPDLVLITDQGLSVLGGADKVWKQPGIAGTPAARAQRLVAFDALYLLGFGPRLPQAVGDLARRLRAS